MTIVGGRRRSLVQMLFSMVAWVGFIHLFRFDLTRDPRLDVGVRDLVSTSARETWFLEADSTIASKGRGNPLRKPAATLGGSRPLDRSFTRVDRHRYLYGYSQLRSGSTKMSERP